MCKHGTVTYVWVKVPADLAHHGEEYWKQAPIDSCIASLVQSLQEGGIDMRGSCCGHGKSVGEIILQDGRSLVIWNRDE